MIKSTVSNDSAIILHENNAVFRKSKDASNPGVFPSSSDSLAKFVWSNKAVE